MDKMVLTFEIRKDSVLNSNSLPNHHFIKGKISSYLRNLGYETGFENLPEDRKKAVAARKEILDMEEKNKAIKSRITKRIKKNYPDLPKKEQDALVLEEYVQIVGEDLQKSSQYDINPLFDKFTVTLIVYPTTNRRTDPQNYAPTAKNLIDGLTDCGYWPDDDWKHLEETRFRHGGETSGIKDFFKFELVIESI